MTEPVALPNLIKEAISAVIKVLVVFSIIQITGEQLAALLLVVDPVLAVFATLYSRMNSTPTAAPVLAQGTSVTVTTPAGQPDTTQVLT